MATAAGFRHPASSTSYRAARAPPQPGRPANLDTGVASTVCASTPPNQHWVDPPRGCRVCWRRILASSGPTRVQQMTYRPGGPADVSRLLAPSSTRPGPHVPPGLGHRREPILTGDVAAVSPAPGGHPRRRMRPGPANRDESSSVDIGRRLAASRESMDARGAGKMGTVASFGDATASGNLELTGTRDRIITLDYWLSQRKAFVTPIPFTAIRRGEPRPHSPTSGDRVLALRQGRVLMTPTPHARASAPQPGNRCCAAPEDRAAGPNQKNCHGCERWPRSHCF